MPRLQNALRLFSFLQLEILTKPAPSRWHKTGYKRGFPVPASNRNQISWLCSSSQGYDDSSTSNSSSNDSATTKEQLYTSTDDGQERERQDKLDESSSVKLEPHSSPTGDIIPSRQEGSLPNAMLSDSSSALRVVKVVPGKGPPPEPPTTCCGTGCANCVWIVYAEELREYYKDGGDQARKAIEKIDDQSLKMFIKLELGLL